jgi:Polysaccharide pyruvyl transferase
MLAGFLTGCRSFRDRLMLTCCTPFERASQAHRFSSIQWYPYDDAIRDQLIREADVWLGVGDTPFQTDSGDWFITHLQKEMAMCLEHKRPMYFLNVGVGNVSALDREDVREIIRNAERIWTRDEFSRQAIVTHLPEGRVSPGADLAHIYLRTLALRGPLAHDTHDGVALVLNFEKLPTEHLIDDLIATIRRFPPGRFLWLFQECRKFPWSEAALFELFPPDVQSMLVPKSVQYQQATIVELAHILSAGSIMLTSRYHAAVAATWAGSRVSAYPRNDKVVGLIEEICVPPFGAFNFEGISAAIERSRPVPETVLSNLADRAEAACIEWFAACGLS